MEKTKKAYEIVIDSIKEQIMNQELVLGQGLPPEREISEKLGVSRNSVREALKILTVMGVVSMLMAGVYGIVKIIAFNKSRSLALPYIPFVTIVYVCMLISGI